MDHRVTWNADVLFAAPYDTDPECDAGEEGWHGIQDLSEAK